MDEEVAREARLERTGGRRSVWYGKIAKNVTDLAQFAEITIPEFSGELRYQRCRWQARGDVALPLRGDECLVIFDNRNQPWIVAWWPF